MFRRSCSRPAITGAREIAAVGPARVSTGVLETHKISPSQPFRAPHLLG
jgi:hypothetical protein